MLRRPAIAVIGGGDGASVEVLELAHKVGAEIGAHGATLRQPVVNSVELIA